MNVPARTVEAVGVDKVDDTVTGGLQIGIAGEAVAAAASQVRPASVERWNAMSLLPTRNGTESFSKATYIGEPRCSLGLAQCLHGSRHRQDASPVPRGRRANTSSSTCVQVREAMAGVRTVQGSITMRLTVVLSEAVALSR